ncbi:MAG: NAD(P)/FAD-dependent oxidoreductase [Pseudonocardiales bacterium]|nr:NAD(P)/FAD-dependent oxidoreductase [Pseudonocardiales bacterium]
MARQPSIVIIGAGFGGVAQAIELQRHGFSDITILEKASALGGTWFYNTYPGSACDVPSHLYSFSYATRRDWSRLCSPQAEILDYLGEVARHYGIDRLITYGVEVRSCTWEDDARRWTVTAADGRTWNCDALVVATGQLHRKRYPNIARRDAFAGQQFHSAEWNHNYELDGKRVAVVGTGASAVQFVPEIARRVSRLIVFQRTGNWFLPRRNRAYPAFIKAAIQFIPGVQAYRRWFIFQYCESLTLMIRHPRTLGLLGKVRSSIFMRLQLKDPEIRRKVWPDYTFGCKRLLFSSFFLPALQRPNVDLVTERITRITPAGLVAADSTEHEVDCIIWATGFHTNEFMFPMEITGVGKRSLRDAWRNGAHAHLGMTVPGFPSMFILYGPNTNSSGAPIISYLETQATYICQALQQAHRRGVTAIDVRSDVAAKSEQEIQARFRGTAWTHCDSWYRTENGRIVANWPGYMREYGARTRTFNPDDFTFLPSPESTTSTPAPDAMKERSFRSS